MAGRSSKALDESDVTPEETLDFDNATLRGKF